MAAEEIVFQSGALRLAGTLYKPEGATKFPVVTVLHGARGGERSFPFYRHLYQELPKHGIGVLLYDRRGNGASDGNFETATFEDLASDGLAAVEFLQAQPDVDAQRVGVYGISQGGWIAPIVAARGKGTVAFLVVVSGAAVKAAEQMDYTAECALRRAGYAEDVIARALAMRQRVNGYYRGELPRATVQAEIDRVVNDGWWSAAYLNGDESLPADVSKTKWRQEMDYPPLPIWREITQPTLFIFGDGDEFVNVPQSMALFREATAQLPDVTVIEIEGADHLMQPVTNPQAGRVSDEYVQQLVEWLERSNTMSIADNKALVRRVFDDIYNAGQLDAVDEIFAADYVDHSAPPGFPPGLESFKQAFGMFRAAFPDLRVTVEDMIAEDDKVTARLTFRGTHTGALMGIPPTRKVLAISGIAIDRVADGKIVEHWVNRDDLGMLQQLGVIPATA